MNSSIVNDLRFIYFFPEALMISATEYPKDYYERGCNGLLVFGEVIP
jgi:hypothetical protein